MLTFTRAISKKYVTTISDSLKLEGLWWNVESRDNEVSGSLHIKPDGIFLHLNGSVSGQSENPHELNEYKFICGKQYNGCLFTLKNCVEVSKKQPFSGLGYDVQVFSIDEVYIGYHANSDDQLKFNQYRVSYTYLSDWLRNVGLDSPEKVEDGYFIKYDPNCGTTVTQIDLELPEIGCRVEILSRIIWNNNFNKCEIETKSFMNIFCKEPMSYYEINSKILEPMRGFLSLATAQPNSLTEVFATDENYDIQIQVRGDYKGVKRASNSIEGNLIFLAKQITHNAQSFLESWFSLESEMPEVCELFLSVHYAQGSKTNRFLNLIQAIEAYSRKKLGEYKQDKESYRTFVNKIVSVVPEEHKIFVKQSLSYSNKKSLREFLSELIDLSYPLSEGLVSDKEKFIKHIIDTRNYLTHRDSERKKYILTGDNLELMVYSLLWILRIQFLLEIGFTIDECSALLQRCNEFQYISSDPEISLPWRINEVSRTALFDRAFFG
jgi:hypothetical protein